MKKYALYYPSDKEFGKLFDTSEQLEKHIQKCYTDTRSMMGRTLPGLTMEDYMKDKRRVEIEITFLNQIVK
jgi:uncharacterized protein YdcH (DUF465 family)